MSLLLRVKKKLLFIVFTFACVSLVVFFVVLKGRLLLVSSDSMQPALKKGSVVLVLPKKSYTQGEIITYKFGGNSSYLVTHRVLGVTTANSAVHYQTKGDFNEFADSLPVSSSEVIGKVVLSFPKVLMLAYAFLGYMLGALLRRIVLLSKNESCRLS